MCAPTSINSPQMGLTLILIVLFGFITEMRCREMDVKMDIWLTAAQNVEVSKLFLLPSYVRQNKNIQEEIPLCVLSVPLHFFKNYEGG